MAEESSSLLTLRVISASSCRTALSMSTGSRRI
ncbi:hypothetical protein DC415_12255 [Agrobacterium tumefaciens]|uniref:Uncharacterized protein n=1 Tax=Rhizobium rhizogenes TaxID=359 RepID=A0AA92C553_RHIRH|nr:hypothetical protein DC430_09235 [Rhizobium rhizogenes]PVE65861.1 hypothetical protein DC415_12255 [Agrobacterium tumefaciens]PVE75925.1 hypothetical protein DCP16_12255 [Sphingomonas sp. TPD3009]